MAKNNETLIIVAVAGAAIYLLRDPIKKAIGGVGDVTVGAGKAVTGVGSGISDAATGLGEGIGTIGQEVGETAKSILDPIQSAFDELNRMITGRPKAAVGRVLTQEEKRNRPKPTVRQKQGARDILKKATGGKPTAAQSVLAEVLPTAIVGSPAFTIPAALNENGNLIDVETPQGNVSIGIAKSKSVDKKSSSTTTIKQKLSAIATNPEKFGLKKTTSKSRAAGKAKARDKQRAKSAARARSFVSKLNLKR